MSAPEMVLSYVNALKWPLLGLAVIFWLRQSIVELIGRIESARFEGAGVSAELEARAIQTAAAIEVAGRDPDFAVSPLDGELPMSDDHSDAGTGNGRSETTGEPRRLVYVSHTPAVAAAIGLSEADRRRVGHQVTRMKQFAGVEPDLVGIAENPWQAMLAENSAVVGFVQKSYWDRNIGYTPVLWPGASVSLHATFRDLEQLVREADARPRQVTRGAVVEFDRAARSWVGQYAVYLESILMYADRLRMGGHTASSPRPSEAVRDSE
ncbi:hypothetical protein [Nocardia sp. CNY236]|uniref:hypothetical protein n=1 Tax=Nocardia sp. CNY236 TaxID=1169152 RepID=UPI0004241B36|nr:hypothetical protein [Nocardia sp. CNY236]